MKAIVLVSMIVSFVGEVWGRDFTNLEGKTMSAEISHVEGKSVFFVKDDKTYAYPLEQLSEEDREYIARWVEENPIQAPEHISLRIRAQANSLSKQRANEDGRRETVEMRAYDVSVTNESPTAVPGLVCYYQLFVRVDDKYADDGRKIQSVHGKEEIGRLEKRKTTEFQTKPVQLTTGNNAVKGSNVTIVQKWRESLVGGNFHFYIGDKLVATYYLGGFKDKGTASPANEP